MLITMYDTIDPRTIPTGAEAVAGYVGGFWPDYSELVKQFPGAYHKSIAVTADEDADILDVENGDATPDQYPAWHRRQVARGLKFPGPYADATTMPDVLAACKAAGIKREELADWWASWDDNPALIQGGLAHQYVDQGPNGENYDLSVCAPAFFEDSPPAHNWPHYEWFPRGPFVLYKARLSERTTVVRYDKFRARQTHSRHPYRIRLALLRLHLRWLANRVYRVAHKTARPSWGVDHRGWRYQQLAHRAQGQRFV